MALLGLAFKPGTDDVRESPGLRLARRLLERGARVAAWDPVAIEPARKALPGGIEYTDDLSAALRGAEVALIATAWPQIADYDWKAGAELMARPLIFDGRSILPVDRLPATVICLSVGRGGRDFGSVMSDQTQRAPNEPPMVIISAWNDSGGGFTHRLFDGHHQLFVYPFELQLGTHDIDDGFKSWFHDKYRWPVFARPLDTMSAEEIFDAIIDDETKSVLRDPGGAKHRDYLLTLAPSIWRAAFTERLAAGARTRARVVEAYVGGLFDAWRDRVASGGERYALGHCPNAVLDADLILSELMTARMIHVVRSPLSGAVDMRRRRPEIDLATYCRKWSMINMLGFAFAKNISEASAHGDV